MSVYQLSARERAEVSELLLKIETGEISTRRLAVELLLLRRVVWEVRRIHTPNLRSLSPAAYESIERVPLATQRPAWDSLTAEHYEQPDLIGKP